MLTRLIFGALSIGFAGYAVHSHQTGKVNVRNLTVDRSVDPTGFRLGVTFVWFFAALLAVAVVLAPNSD